MTASAVPPELSRRLGWRARIGVVTPAAGMTVTSDFHRIAPAGVALALVSVAKPLSQDSVEQLTEVADGLEDAARRLLLPKANVVLWNTVSGSLIKGVGYDQALIRRIRAATGLPATTASSAMIEAFRALGVRRVCVATPYVDEVNVREQRFIEAHGFEVTGCKGMQILDVGEIIDVPPARTFQLVCEIDTPEADAIFVSCAGLDALDVIAPLEARLGKPVLTTNQVSLWAAFRLAGIRDPVRGYGRLLADA